MTRPQRLPPIVERALRPKDGHCYRHCSRPLRAHRILLARPGVGWVFACPSGVVSVTRYAEWGDRAPTERVARELRRRCVPPGVVRRRDLRSATRHGPELGRAAERRLASRPDLRVRAVYWRVYPFARRSVEHRLFACFRHGAGEVVFYPAPSDSTGRDCPRCAVERRGRRR